MGGNHVCVLDVPLRLLEVPGHVDWTASPDSVGPDPLQVGPEGADGSGNGIAASTGERDCTEAPFLGEQSMRLV